MTIISSIISFWVEIYEVLPNTVPIFLFFAAFGLTLGHYTKRNERGLLQASCVAVAVYYVTDLVGSKLQLISPILILLRALPLWRSTLLILTLSSVLSILAAMSLAFVQIKLGRLIELSQTHYAMSFAPGITEGMIINRYIAGTVCYWYIESIMLLYLRRCPNAIIMEAPIFLTHSPLLAIINGARGYPIILALTVVVSCALTILIMCIQRREEDGSLGQIMRALTYIAMILYGSIANAILLIGTYMILSQLTTIYKYNDMLEAEYCVPSAWLLREKRHVLLCGLTSSDPITPNSNGTIEASQIDTLRCVHTIDETRDAAFLQSELSRDAIWHRQFAPGDMIVSCPACRNVFLAENFRTTCPLCSSENKLWFKEPSSLLIRQTTQIRNGTTVDLLFKPTVVQLRNENSRAPILKSISNRAAWPLLPGAAYLIALLIGK